MEKKIYKLLILFSILVFANIAEAATFSIMPTSGTFEVGDRVTFKILVSSATPINAVSGTVSFPTSIFTIESISKAGSIVDFWVTEPNFSGGAGTLNFEGVRLGGFPGGTGTVITASLRATKPGSGKIAFTAGQVLANDGQGTNVTSSLSGGTFSIEPRKEPREPVEQAVEVEQPSPAKVVVLSPSKISIEKVAGEKFVKGESEYPFSQTVLTFIDSIGNKIFITGSTDDQGDFSFLVPKSFKYGTYKVYAVVVKKDGAHSGNSNELTLEIGNTFSDLSLSIRLSLLGILITLIYLVVRSYFYLKKNKWLSIATKYEAREAEEVAYKNFEKIKNKVGQIADVESDKSKQEVIRGIKSELDQAEELVIKEIKDVENL